MFDLVVITGMSGAGRTEAVHTFEDIGYFCIDNLPPSLLGNLVSLAQLGTENARQLAVVCDLRSSNFSGTLEDELAKLSAQGVSYCVIFLDSNDASLLSRYKANRRRHPMAVDGASISQGIARERAALQEIKQNADYVIDTSGIRTQQMRDKIRTLFGGENSVGGMSVSVYSFGFKHAAAQDADIVMDVRFLPNPYYEPELREKTGLDTSVRDYVMNNPETKRFCDSWFLLLDTVMPGYVAEGKQYLTIAIGCTGGQHRSVAIAAATGRYLAQAGYQVVTSHRDLALAEKGQKAKKMKPPASVGCGAEEAAAAHAESAASTEGEPVASTDCGADNLAANINRTSTEDSTEASAETPAKTPAEGSQK